MQLRGVRLVLVVVALIILIGALFFTPLSIFAQEVTPEPTEVMQPAEPPVVTDQVSIPAWLLLNSAALFMALGAVAVIVTRALERRDLKTALEQVDKRSKDAIEAAYEALPGSAEIVIREFVTISRKMVEQMTAVMDFLDDVTDGEDNTDPADTAEVPRASPPPTP